jgi:hypothetical protein
MLFTFGESSSYETRAYQVYLILIGLAANNQIIDCRLLRERMRIGIGPTLSNVLGRVVNWCIREGLPALTSLVVEKESGKPLTGLATVENDGFAAEQQRVFAFDWFSIMPPTLKELCGAGKYCVACRTPLNRLSSLWPVWTEYWPARAF